MIAVVEIKSAIEKLSPAELTGLEEPVWPEWDRPVGENPPDGRAKLAEAAQGNFSAAPAKETGQ